MASTEPPKPTQWRRVGAHLGATGKTNGTDAESVDGQTSGAGHTGRKTARMKPNKKGVLRKDPHQDDESVVDSPKPLISSVEQFISFAPARKQSNAQSFIHRRLSESRYRKAPSRHAIFENLISLLIHHHRFREAVTVYQRMQKEKYPSSQRNNANMIAIGIANQSVSSAEAMDALERIFSDTKAFGEDDFIHFLSVWKDLELPPHSQAHLVRKFISRRGPDYSPPRKIVNLLAGALAKDGLVNEALEVISRYGKDEEMEINENEVDPVVHSHPYISILSSLDTVDPLSEFAVDRVLKSLRESEVAVDNNLFGTLIAHYAKKRDVRRTLALYDALKQATKHGIVTPTTSVYQSLFKLISAQTTPSGRPSLFTSPRFSTFLRPRLIFADAYTHILSSTKGRTLDPSALDAVQSMMNRALQAFFVRKDYVGALVVLQTFEERRICVNPRTYTIIVNSLARRLNREIEREPDAAPIWGQRLYGFEIKPEPIPEFSNRYWVERLLRYGRLPGLVPKPGAISERRPGVLVPTAAIIDGTASSPPAVMLSDRVPQRLVKRAILAAMEVAIARKKEAAHNQAKEQHSPLPTHDQHMSGVKSTITEMITDARRQMLPSSSPSPIADSGGTRCASTENDNLAILVPVIKVPDACVDLRADPSTIQSKFLVGYQGRFTCPGDRENDTGPAPTDPTVNPWSHWLHPNGEPATDLWPDVSAYTPAELFPVPSLKYRSGDNPLLFSSRNQRTVTRHFEWMSKHGIDGAFLQRNASDAAHEDEDQLGKCVQHAAETENRVFALMYDITDVSSDVIQQDWRRVAQVQRFVYSPSYLREQGKPVVYLWGVGFSETPHTPSSIRNLTNSIRNASPSGAYIIAGVPIDWRNPSADSPDAEDWLDVWLTEFDAICPWSVGRYINAVEADAYADAFLKTDIEFLNWRNSVGKWRQVDYMPVVWPGLSGYNMTGGDCGFNSIKRDGGNFLWRQVYNALYYGSKMVLGATWDEYDAGTALLPAVVNQKLLPVSHYHPLMSLDEDGYSLPSDWYMRICGVAAEILRGETECTHVFPFTELQNYWATRPRYEVDIDMRGYEPSISSTASSSRILEHFPPPPYRSGSSSPSPSLAPSKIHMRLGASSPKSPKAAMKAPPPMMLPNPRANNGRPLPAAPRSADSAATTFVTSPMFTPTKPRFVVQNPSTTHSTPLTSPYSATFPPRDEVFLDIESIATAGSEFEPEDEGISVSPTSSTPSREKNKSKSIGRLLKAMSNSNRGEEYAVPKAAPGEKKVVIRAARSSARRG
ncbi:hypothetical protein VNI00_006640 [Paramarasmius palmivorus]|uniref:Pentatricopeptide repeat domain-containing protein n=1 Tax=Paramarasmius palmivorus TaxID=297713 RepID=A0AAW0D7I8_9AGAR